jgi:hypothetical protein
MVRKSKTALHTLADRLLPNRSTEKTSVVLEKPTPETSAPAQVLGREWKPSKRLPLAFIRMSSSIGPSADAIYVLPLRKLLLRHDLMTASACYTLLPKKGSMFWQIAAVTALVIMADNLEFPDSSKLPIERVGLDADDSGAGGSDILCCRA